MLPLAAGLVALLLGVFLVGSFLRADMRQPCNEPIARRRNCAGCCDDRSGRNGTNWFCGSHWKRCLGASHGSTIA